MKRILKQFGLITMLICLALVVKAEGPDKGITPQSAPGIEKDNQKKETPLSGNSPEKPPKVSINDLENSIDDLKQMVEEIEKRGLSPKKTNKALYDLEKRLWKEQKGLDSLWVSLYMGEKGFLRVWDSAESSICCTEQFWGLLDKEFQQLYKDGNYRDGINLVKKIEAVSIFVPLYIRRNPPPFAANFLFQGCICVETKTPLPRTEDLQIWKLKFLDLTDQDPEYQAKQKSEREYQERQKEEQKQQNARDLEWRKEAEEKQSAIASNAATTSPWQQREAYIFDQAFNAQGLTTRTKLVEVTGHPGLFNIVIHVYFPNIFNVDERIAYGVNVNDQVALIVGRRTAVTKWKSNLVLLDFFSSGDRDYFFPILQTSAEQCRNCLKYKDWGQTIACVRQVWEKIGEN